ncbi:virulence factor TspB C-terminal domain-related protein [Vibrio sp. FJH11]
MSSRDYHFFNENICSDEIWVLDDRYLHCKARSGSNFAGNLRVAIAIPAGQGCPTSHPNENNGNCYSEPSKEPHQCPESGTYISTTWGREGLTGWSVCRSDNCVAAAQIDKHSSMPDGLCYFDGAQSRKVCRYNLFHTGQTCTYNPDNPGVNPPDHKYPDSPVEPPTPDEPPSPDLPDSGSGGDDPIYDPDGKGKPDDPVEKPNPDPKPDPDDPNLTKGDNAIVGELSEANKWLENIDNTLEDLTNTTKIDNDTMREYQTHLLGELKAAHETLKNKPTGGGGGGVGLQSAVAEGNNKLDGIGETLKGIKCEIDDNCEGEGKEKPTAKVDCELSIFECKGDVIQCALLKIEYENSCPTGELSKLENEMNKLFGTDRTDELVDKDVLDFSKIDSKYMTNGVSFGNATCPAPESSTFSHFSGSTTIEISFEPACHYARIAAPIHVILAWIAGLFLIGRTQGAF